MSAQILNPVYLAYLLALIIAVATSFVLVGFIWPRRSAPGALSLMGLLITAAFWSTGNIIEHTNTSAAVIYLGSDMSYIGITMLPVMLFLFVLQFTHNDRWLRPWNAVLFFIVPAIALGLEWTNDLHHLMYLDSYLSYDAPFIIVVKQFGIWFWITVAYGFSLQLAAIAILIHRMFQPPRLFFDQIAYLALAIFFPTVASILYIVGPPQIPHVDWTPASFAVSSICLTLAISRAGFLDVLPVARESTIEHMKEGFVVLDDQDRIVDLNKAMQMIIDPVPATKGQALPENIMKQLLSSSDYVDFCEANIEIALDQKGDLRYYSIHVSPLRKTKRGCSRVLIFYDTTERKQMEEAVKQIAYYDPLTGLPNRSLFSDRAEMALQEANRYGRKLAILVADLDEFKVVNDTYGHAAGDQLLQDLAVRLATVVRKVDTISRLGGDEFIVLLPEITGVDIVETVVHRIMDTLSQPFILGQSQVSITISIGVAIYPEDGEDLNLLIRNADAAMYSVKQKGRNGFTRYLPGMSCQPGNAPA